VFLTEFASLLVCQLLYMFRVVFHPSSGAHNTVSTVSGFNETGTATCHERGLAETVLRLLVLCIDRYWGGHPEHVEQLTG